MAAGAAALVGGVGRAKAQSVPAIVGVTWGGPWIKAAQAAEAKQSRIRVKWVLHEGPTTAIIAKLKASWPRPQIDFIHTSPASIFAMMREGWLEPLSIAAIPELAPLAPDLMVKNDKGETVAVPVASTAAFWVYDEKALGMRIDKPEQLLSPALRGKMLMTPPSVGTAKQIISLALARGGSEHNMDPGFEFVKDLVKAKNVGRVAKTDVDIVNAFTTGEVAIGFVNLGNYNEIRKHRDVTLLSKVPDSPTFKTYLSYEAIVVIKNRPNPKAVTDYINFFVGAPINTDYAAGIGALPTNDKSTVAPEFAAIQLHNEQERKDFGAYTDFDYASRQASAWDQKWELEIAPLLG
jgi:putative spermidine/putrescine transport system substrate-binding protein